jgi:hypothetical protein
MDLLKLIEDKCSYFSGTPTIQGLKEVVSHIEVAERHFENGKKGDDYLFTDVIYRSNHAYEGSLKEAYRVLTGKQAEHLTPNKIEEEFGKGTILKARVLALFKNYRQEWRNESTHDYTLCFSEQEAFLAIVNVCAFFNILLDQMIEKKAYDQEKTELLESEVITQKQVQHENLIEQISQYLVDFSNKTPTNTTSDLIHSHNELISRNELLGMLAAYIESSDKEIEVITEYPVATGERKLYADMLVRKGENSLVIELKNATKHTADFLKNGEEQLSLYMDAADIRHGILYIISGISGSTKMKVRKVEITRDGENKHIMAVFPE